MFEAGCGEDTAHRPQTGDHVPDLGRAVAPAHPTGDVADGTTDIHLGDLKAALDPPAQRPQIGAQGDTETVKRGGLLGFFVEAVRLEDVEDVQRRDARSAAS